MTKLLLTLLMMFTFGTSTVNAEENTINIEDRISELAERKPENRSSIIARIIARIEELSEDELKAIIENVNELTEPTEDELATKEAATSKLKEMKKSEERSSTIGLFWLMFSLLFTLYICFWDAVDYGS